MKILPTLDTKCILFSSEEVLELFASSFGIKNDDLPFAVGIGGGGRILNFNARLVQFLLTIDPVLKNGGKS